MPIIERKQTFHRCYTAALEMRPFDGHGISWQGRRNVMGGQEQLCVARWIGSAGMVHGSISAHRALRLYYFTSHMHPQLQGKQGNCRAGTAEPPAECEQDVAAAATV